jgi:hypothetical protein
LIHVCEPVVRRHLTVGCPVAGGTCTFQGWHAQPPAVAVDVRRAKFSR